MDWLIHEDEVKPFAAGFTVEMPDRIVELRLQDNILLSTTSKISEWPEHAESDVDDSIEEDQAVELISRSASAKQALKEQFSWQRVTTKRIIGYVKSNKLAASQLIDKTIR